MSRVEPRIARDGSGAFHRRHELVAIDDRTVVAGMEDDMHRFELTVHHDGRAVTAVEGRAVRWPWVPCADSPTALAELAGMPLDPSPTAIGGWADSHANCTHLFDLAGLAVAHAARHVAGGSARRSYLAVVPDWFEPPYEAWIVRDGEELLRWTIDGRAISAPERFAGVPLAGGFVEWCRRHLDDDMTEAAFLLRRAVWMSPARHIDLEQYDSADQSHVKHGVCFTAQPQRLSIARRNRNSLRDYGTDPDEMLAGFPVSG